MPTKTTGTIYTSPFAISATTTINYRAYDNAGNLENNHVLAVQIDPIAPTATLTAPNPGATVSGTVTLSATAADGGGSRPRACRLPRRRQRRARQGRQLALQLRLELWPR